MITTRSIKTFFIGLSLTFLMAIVPHLWALPKPIDALEKVKPRLEVKQDDFEQASAYAAVDFDSGQILASKNFSRRIPMASLTKIMTAVAALDLAQPSEEFIVSEKAAAQIPTKVMLKPGEKYSLEKLLNFMLISSANDSAQAIQDGIDQKFGQGTFIKAMNFKAQSIGLKNTHFTNAAGYDNNNHYSSVEDLSLLSRYALKEYPEISNIVAKEFEDLTEGQDFRFYLNNWNGLLGIYPGVSGIKIGNTAKAGNCTIVISEREGKKVLAVLLGAPGVLERDLWASRLLDIGFEKLAGLTPVQITEGQLKAKYASWKYF